MDEHFVERAQQLEDEQRDAGVRAIRGRLRGEGQPYCDGCGELIAAARRAALPSAVLCIECQQAAERGSRR